MITLKVNKCLEEPATRGMTIRFWRIEFLPAERGVPAWGLHVYCVCGVPCTTMAWIRTVAPHKGTQTYQHNEARDRPWAGHC